MGSQHGEECAAMSLCIKHEKNSMQCEAGITVDTAPISPVGQREVTKGKACWHYIPLVTI